MINMAWIHIAEQKLGRRLTDDEVDSLEQMLTVRGWLVLFETRVREDEDVKKALDNYVESCQ